MIPTVVRARDGHVLLDPASPDEELRDGRRVFWIHDTDLASCRRLRSTLEFQIGLVETGYVPNRLGWIAFSEPDSTLPPIVAV